MAVEVSYIRKISTLLTVDANSKEVSGSYLLIAKPADTNNANDKGSNYKVSFDDVYAYIHAICNDNVSNLSYLIDNSDIGAEFSQSLQKISSYIDELNTNTTTFEETTNNAIDSLNDKYTYLLNLINTGGSSGESSKCDDECCYWDEE